VENRRLERILLPRPVLLFSGTLGLADSWAVLRDITAMGAYCYTLLPLAEGEVLELYFTISDSEGVLPLSFTGTVVRVEPGATGNSMGIALAFSHVHELAAAAAN
jgi:hypothetical protein